MRPSIADVRNRPAAIRAPNRASPIPAAKLLPAVGPSGAVALGNVRANRSRIIYRTEGGHKCSFVWGFLFGLLPCMLGGGYTLLVIRLIGSLNGRETVNGYVKGE
jgi:hypothetical protein